MTEKKYIWVVDDVKMYRADLKEQLQAMGCVVKTFNNPVIVADALREFAEEKKTDELPDMIVTDYDFIWGEGDLKDYTPAKWEKYDGGHIISTTAALPECHHIPILVCSGDDTLKYRSWPPQLQVKTMGKASASPEYFQAQVKTMLEPCINNAGRVGV